MSLQEEAQRLRMAVAHDEVNFGDAVHRDGKEVMTEDEWLRRSTISGPTKYPR